jgi:hypothetical protein
MAGGAWLGLRPYLTRESVAVALIRYDGVPSPSSDAVESGFRLALEERAHRAGRFRARYGRLDPSQALFLTQDVRTSPPAPFDGDVVAVVTCCPEGQCEGEALLTLAPLGLEDGEPESCFRLLPGLKRQGEAAARWAQARRAGRPFVVREMFDDEIDLVVQGFRAEAARAGLEILEVDPYHEPVESLAGEIRDAKADLVFFGGEKAPYAKANRLFAALRDQGFRGTLLVADPDPGVSLLAVPGSLPAGTYVVSSLAPPPADFASRYRAFAGKDPGPHVYYGYLAGRAALEAIEAANSKDREAVRRAAPAKGPATAANAPALYLVQEGRVDFVEILK